MLPQGVYQVFDLLISWLLYFAVISEAQEAQNTNNAFIIPSWRLPGRSPSPNEPQPSPTLHAPNFVKQSATLYNAEFQKTNMKHALQKHRLENARHDPNFSRYPNSLSSVHLVRTGSALNIHDKYLAKARLKRSPKKSDNQDFQLNSVLQHTNKPQNKKPTTKVPTTTTGKPIYLTVVTESVNFYHSPSPPEQDEKPEIEETTVFQKGRAIGRNTVHSNKKKKANTIKKSPRKFNSQDTIDLNADVTLLSQILDKQIPAKPLHTSPTIPPDNLLLSKILGELIETESTLTTPNTPFQPESMEEYSDAESGLEKPEISPTEISEESPDDESTSETPTTPLPPESPEESDETESNPEASETIDSEISGESGSGEEESGQITTTTRPWDTPDMSEESRKKSSSIVNMIDKGDFDSGETITNSKIKKPPLKHGIVAQTTEEPEESHIISTTTTTTTAKPFRTSSTTTTGIPLYLQASCMRGRKLPQCQKMKIGKPTSKKPKGSKKVPQSLPLHLKHKEPEYGNNKERLKEVMSSRKEKKSRESDETEEDGGVPMRADVAKFVYGKPGGRRKG